MRNIQFLLKLPVSFPLDTDFWISDIIVLFGELFDREGSRPCLESEFCW